MTYIYDFTEYMTHLVIVQCYDIPSDCTEYMTHLVTLEYMTHLVIVQRI